MVVGETIESIRDLRVWQAGMGIVESVYQVTGSFPAWELYGLTSQIRRAAVSIPANLAEGHCREHIKEYLNFLSIAQGSVAELETELEIPRRLKYIAPEPLGLLLTRLSTLAKQLRSLRRALANRTTTKR
jgi:four helix bundle protein